ncbi:hypothetical protein DQ04_04541020 [Trypanosoma grayi]|uniref:hypothetical protein n=1 Tax=Trypanosoma grayi TaxID=71804 RepID=UPI0004F42866|nr:hypothetical protein DQ04_04541020 [Trypanosoma grayi]KEG09845.1 hypothetical protein DQ04_04541020 [Trypanosoma grayi]
MTLAANGQHPSGRSLAAGHQQQVADSALAWSSTLMYPSRSASLNDSDTSSTMAYRALAETVLNLEQQLKVWRRRTCRKLDGIESRLRRCEAALQMRMDAVSVIDKRVATAAADVRLKGKAKAESKHDSRSEAQRVEATLCKFREVVAGGFCSKKLQHITTAVDGAEEEEEEEVRHRYQLHNRAAAAAAAACGEKEVSGCFSPMRGISSSGSTTVVGGGGRGDDVPGLTPDCKSSPAAEGCHASGEVREWWNYHQQQQQLQQQQQQTPPPPTPSFATITPASHHASHITGSACHDSSSSCSCCCWVGSPYVQEPHKPPTVALQGVRAVGVRSPPDVRAPRTGVTDTKTATVAAKVLRGGTSQTPPVEPPSLQRRLLYSPDEQLAFLQQRGVSPAVAQPTARSPSPSPRIDELESPSVTDSLKNTGGRTEPTLRSPLLVNDRVQEDASLPPKKSGVTSMTVHTGVPSAPPLYMLPQQLYGSDEDVADAHSDINTENAQECDRSSGSSGTNGDAFVVVPPSTLAVGSVWQKAVALAHAEQQNEQLQRPPQHIASMLSSAMLDVSDSTA